jgi:hypothetical protein
LGANPEIDAKDSEGCTPLMVAATRNQLPTLLALLKRGASTAAQGHYMHLLHYRGTAADFSIQANKPKSVVPFFLLQMATLQ